jgi:hypothetical protein
MMDQLKSQERNARALEDELLERCAQVALKNTQKDTRCMKTEKIIELQDPIEASIFILAASLIRSQRPIEADRLEQAGAYFFKDLGSHQGRNEKMMPQDILKQGRIQGLPRFRDMLLRKISSKLA